MSDSSTPRPPRDPERFRSFDNYRKGKYAQYVREMAQSLTFHPDPDFLRLADEVVATRRTLLGLDRLYVLWQAARNVATIPGAVAEIGSYRGGSAWFLASAFGAFGVAGVPMHIFDTFEGHPQAAITGNDPFHEPGLFSGTSYDDVRQYLSPFAHLQVHKGDVASSLPQLAESQYRFVHIDTDLYQPTAVCLEYFGARLSPGGIVVVDDYASRKCQGVPMAVAEYLRDHATCQAWDMRTEQLVLIKR